ncbi:MAG: hypothetical protein JWM47_2181 [Acidimicrobiales bacterium]|nr:hypothetical protein [Acidimicrobiales bacterium]
MAEPRRNSEQTAPRREVRPAAAAAAPSPERPSSPLLDLQAKVGNQTVSRLAAGDLTVGRADDPSEHAADQAVASVLGRMPTHASPSSDRLGGQPVDRSVGDAINGARGGGSPLPAPVRRRFEEGYNADLGGVRVHADSRADTLSRSLDATAFTTGSDIFFRSGAYNPSSNSGQEVLGHELAHVVQQTGTASRRIARLSPPGQAPAVIRRGLTDTATPAATPASPATPAEKRANQNPHSNFMGLDEWVETTGGPGIFRNRHNAITAISGWIGKYHEHDKGRDDGVIGNTALMYQVQLLAMIESTAGRWMYKHTVGAEPSAWEEERRRAVGRLMAQSAITKSNLQAELRARGAKEPDGGLAAELEADGVYQEMQEKYPEGDAKSFIDHVATGIGKLASKDGDKARLTVDFKWPVEPSGICFVGGKISFAVEVGQSSAVKPLYRLRADVAAKVGVRAILIDLETSLGGFIETQGETPQEALKLFSYALFRTWRESKVLNGSQADYIWGKGAKGERKADANAWGEEMEKILKTNPEAFAAIGVTLGVAAEVGSVDDGRGASASLTAESTTRFDKESLAAAAARNKPTGDKNVDAQAARGTDSKSVAFELKGAMAGFQVGGSLKGTWENPPAVPPAKPKRKWTAVDLELNAGISVPAGDKDSTTAVVMYEALELGLAIREKLQELAKTGDKLEEIADSGESVPDKALAAIDVMIENFKTAAALTEDTEKAGIPVSRAVPGKVKAAAERVQGAADRVKKTADGLRDRAEEEAMTQAAPLVAAAAPLLNSAPVAAAREAEAQFDKAKQGALAKIADLTTGSEAYILTVSLSCLAPRKITLSLNQESSTAIGIPGILNMSQTKSKRVMKQVIPLYLTRVTEADLAMAT